MALAEYSVSTPEGVKGPDVVWLSPERAELPQDDFLDDLLQHLALKRIPQLSICTKIVDCAPR